MVILPDNIVIILIRAIMYVNLLKLIHVTLSGEYYIRKPSYREYKYAFDFQSTGCL